MDKVKLRALVVMLRRAFLMAAKGCEIFLEETHDAEIDEKEDCTPLTNSV